MQNTTADYKLEINKPSRSFECKVTIGDNIYKNEDIVDIILDHPQPQDGFSIGNIVSQTLDLTLINKGDTIYSTSQIKLEIGLKIGSTIEYIPMGIFNIDDVEKTDYTTKFTCYDNMIKFEKTFSTSLGETLTLQQVVNELTRIAGVEFTGSLPAYTVKKLDGFSCREVLGYVASICGGNAVITRDGKFAIKSLSEVNKSIDGNNYITYTKEEIKYKIGQISCQVDENNILSKGSLGTDSMELQFENPWVNATILTDIYNKLNGLSYLGYSMKWQGDLSLDPYDVITITDKKGVVRKEPILSYKITYTGGLTSEIGAKGETKNKNSFSSSGSTTNKVNRAVMELAVINKALIDKANIKDLVATNAEIANLKAKDVEIENALIKKANIEDLTAINASIQNLIAADANITKLIATKADITDLTATNIKFNVGTGGTLDLQTLLSKFVTGENGQFLNLTTDNVTISNAVIKDIIAKNISVEDLKAGKISTNKFNISSDDGGITIVGPTMQFKDKSNKVRIQMGQDTQGNFNFILRGEDGTTTLIDHTGIKEKAIADDLIKSNMVAADAIGEKQINYSSLITGLNKDTNTSLIQASKVAIDLTGQSLEVAFNSLKTNVDSIEVGGTNIATETNNGIQNWNWSMQFGGKTTTEVIENNIKCCKFTRDNTVQSGWSYMTYSAINKEKYMPDRNYTVSFEVKASVVTSFWCQLMRGDASYSMTSKSNTSEQTIADKWTKITMQFRTVSNIPTTGGQVLYISGMNSGIGVSYIFRNLKIEEGTKATDWTPAIEDTDQKIEANTTAIKVEQGKIEGLIKESSITKGDVTTLKDNYTSIKATVDGINTTVSSHTSSITNIQTTANNALANANNANSKIDGLEIGVRNLIIHTDEIKNTYLNADGGLTSNTTTSTMKDYISVVPGEVLMFQKENSEEYFRYNWYDKNKKFISRRAYIGNIFPWTVPENAYYIRVSYPSIGNVKVERGTKATGYSPAPEDVDSSINSLSGKVTTVENKQATLSQSLEGFKTTVANTYSTKTELSNLSGTVSSINSRVSTAESSITQLNNKIDLKVEATDITNAINNLSIGGRNYIKDYKFEKSDIWLKTNATVDTTNNQGQLTGTTNTSWLYQEYKNNEFKVGDKLTLQYEMKCEGVSGSTGTNSFLIRTQLTGYLSDGAHVSDVLIFKKHESDYSEFSDWKKVTVTGVVGNYNFDFTRIRFYARNFKGKIYFRNVKLERGSKATDLSEAPEDIDTKIETTNNKVATIETNLNSITSRVSSTESTVKTINGNVSSLQSRMSSAESKITSSAIINTVQATINNAKNEAINSANANTANKLQSYATKTEVTTTAENVIYKFSASGGYNLLKNSSFANKNIDNWWVWGGVSRWTDTSYYKEVGDMYIVNTNTNNPGGLWQSEIPIKPNTKYTLSVRCHKEKNVKGGWFGLEYQSSIDGDVITYQNIELTFDDKRHSYTFTTPNNSNIKYAKVGFRHEGAISSGGYCLIKINKPCLAEGEISVWSPNPFEIKDGSTIIDADGVKIYNGALTVLNNAGQIVLQGDSNGDLTFKGKLQPNDYQLRLFGNDCKIDGSANAIRMQLTSQIYLGMDSAGALRIYNQYSNNGTRYISAMMTSEGHVSIYNDRTRMKLLGSQNERPVIQCRNTGDNAYGDFHGADFLNRSTIKDKTNVETIEELDFSKILLENNIFKYNLKTDVENILEKFGLDDEYNLDEVIGSSADGRLGFILEELTEEAKALLSPGNMESISIYSMCSILWKICQQYHKRIEVLESKVT